MKTLKSCPMPTCGAPIDAVHLVPQGMGAFTYVVRCDCGLSFDTGAQSEAAAADRWNERPAPASAPKPVEDADFSHILELLYRGGSEGEEPKFTKYNMQVAFEAGRAHPAPAGVVLPERKPVKVGEDRRHLSYCEQLENRKWNACREETARLNGVKP